MKQNETKKADFVNGKNSEPWKDSDLNHSLDVFKKGVKLDMPFIIAYWDGDGFMVSGCYSPKEVTDLLHLAIIRSNE